MRIILFKVFTFHFHFDEPFAGTNRTGHYPCLRHIDICLRSDLLAPFIDRADCFLFTANAVRLQLHALTYNPANFLRTFILPTAIAHCSLANLPDRMITIGAKAVHRARSIILQLAEAAVPRHLWT